jgi:prepilin-type N-terminal cleavage/methylation domain-containing protein
MITNLAKSYVRTVVPVVVGAIVAWALHHGHDIHGYESLVTAVVTALYYGAARLLEHYVSPQFGWLLGSVGSPAYTTPAKAPAKQAGLTLIEVIVVVTLLLVILLIVGVIH